MKKIDLSPIQANVRGMVLEDKTIAHILESYQEGFEALLLALQCNPNEITVLSGADVIEGVLQAGWIAYGNEIFQVDEKILLPWPGDYVWQIETTYPVTDPVKFDDGNEFNINQIRKMTLIEDDESGFGIADRGSEARSNEWIQPELLNGWRKSNAAAYASSAQPRYLKKHGVVYVKGRLVRDSNTSDPAFTLPVGFRPDQDITGINSGWAIRTDGRVVSIAVSSFNIDVSFPVF